MKTRVLGLFAALGAVSAFCAGCDSDDGSAPPPPPEVELGAIAQELDDVVCQLAFECECTFGRTFQSPAECTQWAQSEQALAERLINDHDLTWDPTCTGWYLRGYETAGCGSSEVIDRDPDGDGCFARCSPLHGTRAAGQSCTQFDGGLSDCGQGMWCNGAECVEHCPPPAAEGEACGDRPCAVGLNCEFDGETPRCALAPREGEPCVGVECGEGLRCVLEDPTNPTDPDPRCRPLGKIAEACMGHGECDSGYCPAGYCDAVPGRGGDCRGTGICDAGLACVDDVCRDALERGDRCETSCGGGLECIDSVCVGANAAACYPDRPISG